MCLVQISTWTPVILIYLVVFLRPARKLTGHYLNYAKIDSFQISSNSLFINHLTIRSYIVSDTGTVLTKKILNDHANYEQGSS
jgi:hypothetical protein